MTFLSPKYAMSYSAMYYRKRKEAFLSDKKCAQCGSKLDLIICGTSYPKDGVKVEGRAGTFRNGNFFTWSKERQDESMKSPEFKILCESCRYPVKNFMRNAQARRSNRKRYKKMMHDKRERIIQRAKKEGIGFLLEKKGSKNPLK